jgi:hypothetical protein
MQWIRWRCGVEAARASGSRVFGDQRYLEVANTDCERLHASRFLRSRLMT